MHRSAVAVIASAWCMSFIMTLLTKRFATRVGLLDAPNERSSHTIPTANGGGLGFVLAGCLSAAVMPDQRTELVVVLLLSLAIAGVGLRDDIRHVPVHIRFLTQFLVSGGALFALGVFQHSHPLVVLLALMAGVWWINLFNFMDGIDGIAGMQAVFMLVAAAALAAWQQPHVTSGPEWIWMIAIAAAVVAFLQFNWPPATIFMGDVGSTWLAYVMFVFAVMSVRDGWLAIPTWLILGGLFIADSTTTLLRRLLRRTRWFEAHRSHAYQRLAMRWRSHRRVTLVAAAVNVCWLAPLAYASLRWADLRWPITVVALLPLVAGALSLGAGRSDAERRMPAVGGQRP
jgi:Fuc2NAc and GlcNAc transferase